MPEEKPIEQIEALKQQGGGLSSGLNAEINNLTNVQALQRRVEVLEEFVQSLQNPSEVPPEVVRALQIALFELDTGALPVAYDRNVDEGGSATYEVAKVYDGMTKVGDKIFGYYDEV